MTLQQLKYIVAIDRHRNFARASEELGVTQPTLSALLVKLESELDRTKNYSSGRTGDTGGRTNR